MSTVASLMNGIKPTPVSSYSDVAEFLKILKFRDKYLGVHPHLTVPSHLVQDLSALPQLTSQANLAAPTGAHVPAILPTQRDALKSPAAQPAAVSEINPILLTKSDDLVRAEGVLKRQRLEKVLKEQFEQKRLDSRKRPAPAEAIPSVNIPAILAKATGANKEDSGKDDGEASDSFDENSLYSSRAPDSTPERGAPSPSPEPGTNGDRPADSTAKSRVQSAVMGAPLDADADDEYSPRLGRRDTPAYSPALEPDDEEEEGEYSPPEAVEQDTAMQDAYAAGPSAYDPRSRQLRRYSGLDDGNVRIVRNHITSPMAPQPSRISPLVAKQPPSQQNTRARRDRSPNGQHPKKKRKLDKRDKRLLHPGVKEENVSPPPFHDVRPLGSGRPQPSNVDQPILIEDAPRQLRYAPLEQSIASPRGTVRYADPIPPMPQSEPRVMSRQSLRPLRDTQDLRRVASMHNVRAEMGDELGAYGTPPRPRVATYRESSPIVAQQALDDPYERQPMQEVRISRTPAPVYRDVYPEDAHVRYEPMPPPPVERIVVDQYGRRFREIVEQRPTVVSRAESMRPEAPAEYDNYQRTRAGSTFVDLGQERRYTQTEMPPPPPIYRQEAPRSSVLPPAQPTPRSSSVMHDRVSRPMMYADDRGEFREPVRTGSVRPVAQYEELPIMRATSVRPGGREPTYMPVEQPRYRTMEQPGQRYFDEHGREIIMQRF